MEPVTLNPHRPRVAAAAGGASAIDRRALVARHDPVVRSVDPWSTLSVGNGRFAFTADVTGLQTFPEAYAELPLATQSEWGWNSFPDVHQYTLGDAVETYDVDGRPVPYAGLQSSPAGQALRESPHRLSLASVGFVLRRRDGEDAGPADPDDIEQRLDLWSGALISRFRVDGRVVRVVTCAHPEHDVLAVRIEADELDRDFLAVRFASASTPCSAPVGIRVMPSKFVASDRTRTSVNPAFGPRLRRSHLARKRGSIWAALRRPARPSGSRCRCVRNTASTSVICSSGIGSGTSGLRNSSFIVPGKPG